MLADEGTLRKMGRTDELLGVVGKYGDRGMDFIWKNKGALTVAATLTAFLANPQPFIDGTAHITKVVAENVVKPVAAEAAKNTSWTFVLPVLGVIVGAIVAMKIWLRHRSITALAPPGRDSVS
jgi:hypothetical protein